MALTCNVNIDVKNNQQQAPIQSVNYVSIASSWSCSTNITKKGTISIVYVRIRTNYANLRTFYANLRRIYACTVVRTIRKKLRRAKERSKTRYCRTKRFYKYWYESRRSRCVNVSNFRLLLCCRDLFSFWFAIVFLFARFMVCKEFYFWIICNVVLIYGGYYPICFWNWRSSKTILIISRTIGKRIGGC